jgi:hypothetical protein
MESRRATLGIGMAVFLCGLGCAGGDPSPGAAASPAAGPIGEEQSLVTVATPPAKLGGHSNYVMGTNDCSTILKDVVVTIDITEDLVVSSSSAVPGFGFQLNANSQASGAETSASDAPFVWQQYFIRVHDDFIDEINNWNRAALAVKKPTISSQIPFTVPGFPTSAATTTLPAGYKLKFALINDGAGNITECDFTVTNKKGESNTQKFGLVAVAGALSKELAPIVAFQMDLVGVTGGTDSTFTSGAGTITYTASTSFSALQGIPKCAASGTNTLENSNSVYGPMPTGSKTSFVQAFAIPVPLCLIPECKYSVCCIGGTCLSEPTDLSNPSSICCDGNACNAACCAADTPCTDVATSTCGSKCASGTVPTPIILASGSPGVNQTCKPPPPGLP